MKIITQEQVLSKIDEIKEFVEWERGEGAFDECFKCFEQYLKQSESKVKKREEEMIKIIKKHHKNYISRPFSSKNLLDRSNILVFLRQWTELYDKKKEHSFQLELKSFIEDYVQEAIIEQINESE